MRVFRGAPARSGPGPRTHWEVAAYRGTPSRRGPPAMNRTAVRGRGTAGEGYSAGAAGGCAAQASSENAPARTAISADESTQLEVFHSEGASGGFQS